MRANHYNILDSLERETIMLVDDNTQNLKVLANILEPLGYDLILCTSAQEAAVALEDDFPDLILLDVMMPGTDGYTFCELLKKQTIYQDIPILFLTAKVSPEDIERGFLVGGDDYITKPFHELELKVRIQHLLKIKHLQAELKKAAIIDPLTQLYNRRFMLDRLQEEIDRFKRHKIPVAVALADIDFFKSINDTHGHNCGDLVLKEFAKRISEHLRSIDTLCRWGGEEFLFLLPETELNNAFTVCERIRESIENKSFGCDNKSFSITLTIGLTAIDHADTIEDIIKRADEALFKGKSSGRNIVMKG